MLSEKNELNKARDPSAARCEALRAGGGQGLVNDLKELDKYPWTDPPASPEPRDGGQATVPSSANAKTL